MEVPIPDGVTVTVHDRKITVKGQKASVEKDFDDPRFNALIKMSVSGNNFVIESTGDRKKTGAMVGTIASHAKNMMLGVTKDYQYTLKIVYTHFPMSITVADGKVSVKNFLGEKGARIVKVRGDAKVQVDKEEIHVTGYNLEDVSQTAANIERSCKLKGRDRRIFQDGIFITHKAK